MRLFLSHEVFLEQSPCEAAASDLNHLHEGGRGAAHGSRALHTLLASPSQGSDNRMFLSQLYGKYPNTCWVTGEPQGLTEQPLGQRLSEGPTGNQSREGVCRGTEPLMLKNCSEPKILHSNKYLFGI